jgi:tetraacyldisaccharide 4'-kinase
VNALNPFGNGSLIPAGILREPVESLKRADLVVITNADLIHENDLRALDNTIREKSGKEPIYTAYEIAEFRNALTGQLYSKGQITFRNILCVSSLGQNNGFAMFMKNNGFNILKHFHFRDHHWYQTSDLQKITAYSDKISPIITTTKDYVKLQKLFEEVNPKIAERFYIAEVRTKFLKGGRSWEEKLEAILASL